MVTNSLHNMREALESIRNLAFEVQDMNSEGDVKTSLPPKWVIDVVNSALSAPPRNCDIGTAEEQAKRWKSFCTEHHEWKPGASLTASHCDCPCYDGKQCNMFVWAQMPYEKGGAK